jgi:hypothetical protein
MNECMNRFEQVKYTTITMRVGWGGDEAEDDAEEGGSGNGKRPASPSADSEPVPDVQSTPTTDTKTPPADKKVTIISFISVTHSCAISFIRLVD